MSTHGRNNAGLQNELFGLSNICYTQENILRANHYLASRGIDPSKLQYPCTMTPTEPMFDLAPYIRPQRVTDTLLIPVTSIRNPKALIAFDCRYLGSNPMVPRYWKAKGSPPEPMISGIWRAMTAPKGTPVILTEGFIDAEAAYQMTGLPAVAYLTALAAPSVVATLLAITDTILLALDNDQDGIDAVNKLFNIALQSRASSKLFVMVNYAGKDPGKAGESEQGRQIFREGVANAIELAKSNRIKPDINDPFVKVLSADAAQTQMLAPGFVQAPVLMKPVDPFAR